MVSVRRISLQLAGVCVLAGSTMALGQWTVIDMNPPGVPGSGIGAVTATQQGGGATLSSGFSVPSLWSGAANTWVPLASDAGGVYGISETMQVGRLLVNSVFRASIWRGTPQSRVDLHPANAAYSQAWSTLGDQQAGVALFASQSHASMWRGTAASWVDLHPAGMTDSEAFATDGEYQGGYVIPAGPVSYQHAALWNGTASSFIDLNPFGASSYSVIRGMVPGQQVGWTVSSNWGIAEHASIWSGTAASWIDVNPYAGFFSQLFGTCGRAQVGRAGVPGFSVEHAGLWFGSAESFVDLQQFLPAEYNRSIAWSVAELPGGGLIVGGQASRPNNTGGACIWVLAPAPGVMPLLWAAGVVGMRRRRV